MSRRLVKIAKELNVGLSTIVGFLHGKGFEIESKPTAKVSDEMYQELTKEFSRSIAIKEQADQMIIGIRPSRQEEEARKQEAVILPPKVEKMKPAPKVEKVKLTPKVEEAKSEPKVEEAKPAPKVEEAKPEPKVEEAKPAPKVEEVKPEPKKEEAKTVEPKVEEAKPEPKKEEAKAESKVEETKPEPKVEEAKAEPKVEETKPEPKKEQAKAAFKVVGKIDLSKIGKKPSKKKGKKPTPPSPVTETPKKAVPVEEKTLPEKEDTSTPTSKPTQAAKATSDEANKPKESGPEMVRAKTPELRGLKILGKIDASKLGSGRGKKSKDKKDADKNKGTQAGAGAAGNKRRRRKRKKITGTTGTTGTPRTTGSTATSGGAGSRARRPAQRGGSRRPGARRDEVREVSKKEIEDKIKATMARMAGGGKKKRQKLRRDNRERLREKQEAREQETHTDKLQVTEFISVQELANLMDVSATDVIMTCMNLGVIVSINQRLDAEVIELVAEEFEHEVEFISVEAEEEEEEEYIDDPANLLPRAPVVTIMGHVDHGKTSLLDYIRKANVADSEAGGITQHIGAYEVYVNGDEEKPVTFLDTPGHEAFTAMRARGAKVTDIAVIIIAADDSIMPQTKEAISHAEAAGVPIIFAINKIDKPGANVERIKQELSSMNYLVEEWGGKYGSADISAKMGTNIDGLLERIQLEAEMHELKANPNRPAIGTVLEASLDKGRGYVTKMLVSAGTLKIGDSMVSGEHSGRVKAMFNERNERIKEAGPSTPVLVLGLGGAPQAGERFKIVNSEQEAREIANRRGQIAREQANRATKRISLDEIGRRLALGNFKELNLIVKGDVDGSVEALSDSLIKLSQETVQVNVIHRAVGQIIESDVLLGTASNAIIIGFQVRPSSGARKLAEREGVQIKTYSIIYEVIDEIKKAIEGMLETIKEENILGQVEVKEIFKISKIGTVAGCYVLEGKILRDNHVRLIRDGIVIYPTKEGQVAEINALKRFKDDVKEVRAGMECGLSIKKYNDIKVGDIVEAYEVIEIKQKLKT